MLDENQEVRNKSLLVEKLENTIGMDDQFIVYCSDSDCGSSEDLSYELQSYGYNNILLFNIILMFVNYM